MAIERIKGAVAFFCDLDGCDEGIETDERQFEDALSHAKAEGWVFAKRGPNEWSHFCCAAHEQANYRHRRGKA